MAYPTWQQAIIALAGPDTNSEPLWSGRVAWDDDEDEIKSVSVPALDIGAKESIVLVARNSSPTVDMVVNVGHVITATSSTGATSWAVTGTAATDRVGLVAHGLKVGDVVYTDTATTDLTADTPYYVVGATHNVDVNADYFYLLAAGRDNSADPAVVDLTEAESWTLQMWPEFVAHTSFTVPKFAAASSTAPIDGFVSKVITGWGKYGGRIMVEKSDDTAGVCTCYLAIYRG